MQHTQLTEREKTMLNDYEKSHNYSLSAQEENFEFTLDGTTNGYLLTWGDYVANTEAKGFQDLSEAFTFLALISADGHQGTREYLFANWKKIMQESEAN